MQFINALLFPALVATAPYLRSRSSSPPPGGVSIVNATTSGNGCPQGSATQNTSVVTFGFDSFQTYIGPKAKQADKTKQCQLHLTLKYAGGFSYSVVKVTYHGWARLDPGVTGTFVSFYYFSQTATQTASTRSEISGSQWVNGDIYTKDDQIASTATVWSPCGATGISNVNKRIALSTTDTTLSGELSNDDATVAFTHQLHVAWQACTPKGDQGSSGSGGGFMVGAEPTLATAGSDE